MEYHKGDREIDSFAKKCEKERIKIGRDLPKGVYIVNSSILQRCGFRFYPINKEQREYALRFNSNITIKGGKKLNNLIKLAFIKVYLWINNLAYDNNDAIAATIETLNIKGLKNKVNKRYKLYCPQCIKKGRFNYTKTSKLKPRQQFCSYCNEIVLFKTKKNKI